MPILMFFSFFFAINNRRSYEQVKEWVTEVRGHCPRAKLFVNLTKLELRDDPVTKEQLKDLEMTLISEQEGRELANEVGADKYFECSSVQMINVKEKKPVY